MTINVYEYGAVDAVTGEPIHPALITRDVALDTNHTLAVTTRYVEVTTTTDVRIALGSTPTAGDHLLLTGKQQSYRLPERQGVASTIRATSASIASTSAVDVTIALAAGASNGMLITVTAVDASGATVAAVHELDLHFSTSAVGAVVTATAYSGTLVASTGAIAVTVTAAKVFRILTDANGIFVGTLTASGKPATEYVAVRKPLGASLKVSAASGTTWGA